MRTVVVTGSDTGVGKTHATAALARILNAEGGRVQIVKILETGAGGDAARARELAGGGVQAFTLVSFPEPLAPVAAANAAGGVLSLEIMLEKLAVLPDCDWRICEGAGGIATPIDDDGHDWADFAAAVGADAIVIVVPDRLGAINQGRLAHARAADLHAGLWLNAVAPVDRAVAVSTRSGLLASGVPVWAEQAHGAELPNDPAGLLAKLSSGSVCSGVERVVPNALERPSGQTSALGTTRSTSRPLLDRCREALAERDRLGLRRRVRVTVPAPGELNLADNDYLDLARDPAVGEAAAAAARVRTSASASPLITGWRAEHERLTADLCAWHGLPHGLLWNSGYTANAAVLGNLPNPGDQVFADRLIHNSMIAGLLRSGASLRRYPHLDLDRLEVWLEGARPDKRVGDNALHPIFVVTESVFSMDGDYPDLARLAALKRRHGFCLILDEAHALGWYGPEGAGLARAAGIADAVDVLVGTLGKALASGGAYTLFRDEAVRDYLTNFAGEFIYSTALPPANAAAATAAIARVRELAPEQPQWHARSRSFRSALRAAGWSVPEGDSPVVPVRLDGEEAALSASAHLSAAGIRVAAVRPPTVPVGTSRLRLSLKRTFGAEEQERVLGALAQWRDGR